MFLLYYTIFVSFLAKLILRIEKKNTILKSELKKYQARSGYIPCNIMRPHVQRLHPDNRGHYNMHGTLWVWH